MSHDNSSLYHPLLLFTASSSNCRHHHRIDADQDQGHHRRCFASIHLAIFTGGRTNQLESLLQATTLMMLPAVSGGDAVLLVEPKTVEAATSETGRSWRTSDSQELLLYRV
jgi:hypothetical protein